MSQDKKIVFEGWTCWPVIRREPNKVFFTLIYPISPQTYCAERLWLGSKCRRVRSVLNKPRSVSRYGPSLEKNRWWTEQFSSVCWAAPVAASQSRTVRSSDADATILPSREKATALSQYGLELLEWLVATVANFIEHYLYLCSPRPLYEI